MGGLKSGFKTKIFENELGCKLGVDDVKLGLGFFKFGEDFGEDWVGVVDVINCRLWDVKKFDEFE